MSVSGDRVSVFELGDWAERDRSNRTGFEAHLLLSSANLYEHLISSPEAPLPSA